MSVKYTTPAQHKSNLRNVYAEMRATPDFPYRVI